MGSLEKKSKNFIEEITRKKAGPEQTITSALQMLRKDTLLAEIPTDVDRREILTWVKKQIEVEEVPLDIRLGVSRMQLTGELTGLNFALYDSKYPTHETYTPPKDEVLTRRRDIFDKDHELKDVQEERSLSKLTDYYKGDGAVLTGIRNLMKGVGELEAYDYVLGENPDFGSEVNQQGSKSSLEKKWKQAHP